MGTPGPPFITIISLSFHHFLGKVHLNSFIITSKRIKLEKPALYQTKDNFKDIFFLLILAQSYSHSCLSRTQEEWLPHMDFPIPPLNKPYVFLLFPKSSSKNFNLEVSMFTSLG